MSAHGPSRLAALAAILTCGALAATLTCGALAAAAPAEEPHMETTAAAVHSGCVIGAPHEGFDANTAPIAERVADALGCGCVVARGYRQTSARRWIDVNRPSQRRYEGARRGPEEETDLAQEVYAEYQARLFRAGGAPEGADPAPLRLLVEIHGHARTVEVGGRAVKVPAIELATRGVPEEALRALKERYAQLAARLAPEDRVALAVEQLDDPYEVTGPFEAAGQRLRFYFHASGAKQKGSLAPGSTIQALHFELPQHVRLDAARRAKYTELLIELLRPLVP